MKNLFKVLLVAAATSALFACTKEISVKDENPAQVKTVQFSTAPVTKTVFGTASGSTLPTLWTENMTVGISLNLAAAKESTQPVVANGGATATFSADLEAGENSYFVFYAISPYASVISTSADYKSVQVDIPSSQTPLEDSVDEKAQILVAKYDAGSTFPTSSVNLEFAHLTAYGKISFSNLALADGETIASVSLTASKDWAGRFYYYMENSGSYSEGDIAPRTPAKTITLTTSSASDIWFACAPVDMGGESVKVVVTTDKGTTYTKNITIPSGKTFDSGKVNVFTVNMNGITADSAVEYQLVTSASALTAGSKVIIAAPGDVEVAMSTTQNGNNRGSASVTKTNNNTIISSPSDAVQIFTLATGTKANTVAFSTGSGYIYAASSTANHLRTEETLSDNSSWTVTIDSDGVATVVAQGANTRNHMRYNSGNNPPVFSSYSETSSVSTKVSIYKLSATDTRADVSLAFGTASYALTVGTDDYTNFAGQTVTATPAVSGVKYAISGAAVGTIDADSGVVTLDGKTSGTATVTASFSGDESYKPADSASYTIVVSPSSDSIPDPETIDFSTLNLSNGVAYNDAFDGGNFNVTFSAGNNNGKYYTTGTAIRAYGGGSFTVESTFTIARIELTFGSGDGSNDITTDVGAFSSSTWTGSSKSVTFTIGGASGHRRIKAIKVIYEGNDPGTGSGDDPDPGTGGDSSSLTITFADLGLVDGTQYSDPFSGLDFTITFAGGGNDGKYYNTGSGIRTYGDGTITVASSKNISEIEFTWDGSYKPEEDVASPAGYSTDTNKWTGSAKSVVLTRPSGTGHWRLKAVAVKYAN